MGGGPKVGDMYNDPMQRMINDLKDTYFSKRF